MYKMLFFLFEFKFKQLNLMILVFMPTKFSAGERINWNVQLIFRQHFSSGCFLSLFTSS